MYGQRPDASEPTSTASIPILHYSIEAADATPRTHRSLTLGHYTALQSAACCLLAVGATFGTLAFTQLFVSGPAVYPFSIVAPGPPLLKPGDAVQGRSAHRSIRNYMAQTATPAQTEADRILQDLKLMYPPVFKFSRYFDQPYIENVVQKYGPSAKKRIAQVMQWRIRNKVDMLPKGQPRLSADLFFWHGQDNQQRPVLYLRPGGMDMVNYDPAKTAYTLMLSIEAGIKAMPPGVTEFTIVIDTSGVGPLHFNPVFIKPIVQIAVEGYADRIHEVIVGPTNSLVNRLWTFIDSLLPAEFRQKVILSSTPMAVIKQKLDSVPSENLF